LTEEIPGDFDVSSVRDISALLAEQPVLSAAELSTAREISVRRYVPIHRTIGLFLPSPVVARARRPDWDAPLPREREDRGDEGLLSFCRDTDTFVAALGECFAPRTIVLFPDDGALGYWLSRIGSPTDGVSAIPDKSYRTRRATLFREFRAGKHPLVATVRKGVFLPLDGFDRIVAVEEGLGDRYEAFRHEYSFDEWTTLLARRSGLPLVRLCISPPLPRLYEAMHTRRLVTR
jgi:hypothetical protein